MKGYHVKKQTGNQILTKIILETRSKCNKHRDICVSLFKKSSTFLPKFSKISIFRHDKFSTKHFLR